MFGKIDLLLDTVKYLKATQIKHQLLYRMRKPRPLSAHTCDIDLKRVQTLLFSVLPPVGESYLGRNSFCFLNIRVDFMQEIDWAFQGHGKLWNYNLQYANYLMETDLDLDVRIALLKDLYNWLSDGRLPLEPYPASLRIINVIRLSNMHSLNDPDILKFLYAELDFLSRRPEYHLLGNHLLENGFALIMGGAFFSNENWMKQGLKILNDQILEQVLLDGGHFELSPMYHQIIFFRLLELIDWYSNWKGKSFQFEQFLREKASAMRAWLSHMSFSNGSIPHFNDSSNGVAYSTIWLLSYADTLDIAAKNIRLGASGYRSIVTDEYECKVDVGQIGPDYQPGHAHADTLSFILYHRGNPLFVETGTSTYQIGKRRNIERSTAAHNTVVVNDLNQSNVWGGFRVAKRAKVTILKDNSRNISAQHDGYKKFNLIHTRDFQFEANAIIVSDNLSGNDNLHKTFYLHLYPGIHADLAGNKVHIPSQAEIIFKASSLAIRIENYEYCLGFNLRQTAKRIVVDFSGILKTNILFNQ